MKKSLAVKVLVTILCVGGIGAIPFLVVYVSERLTVFYAVGVGGFGVCMIPLVLQQLRQLWHNGGVR